MPKPVKTNASEEETDPGEDDEDQDDEDDEDEPDDGSDKNSETIGNKN